MKKIVKIPLFIKNYLENLFNRAKTTKGMTNLEVEELSDKIDDFVERYKGTDTNQDRETVDKMVNELTSDFEPVVANAERFAGEADSVLNRPQGISALLTEGPERTFQFISERTGLDKGRIKRALIEMMNEGYSGPGKMTTIDDEARIFAFADVNLKDNPLEFMEEVEQIGKNIETDNVIDLEKFRKKEGIETLPTGKTEDAPDEFFEKPEVDMTPEEVDALKTDQFVDETMEVRKNLENLDKAQLTELAGKMAKQVAANDRKIAELIEAGEFDKAMELEKINQKTLSKMSGEGLEDLDEMLDLFPFDPDKPKMAEGGRIGLQDGGGKFPISRRGFLGVLGGGITAALTGGKGLLPAAKTGITAAKTLSAPGMPKWFPLLVSKIQTKGNLVSPAAPQKGEVNAVYKYMDGKTEYKMVEDVNTGRIDIYTVADDGTQIGFEYEPSLQRYFEDGSSVTDEPSFFVGEFRKGSEPGGDFENYAMGMDEVTSDIRNVEEFATRGTTMQADNAIEDFIKRTKQQEPGFKQGGLVPPQAGPMSSGMGSLFRQRTA